MIGIQKYFGVNDMWKKLVNRGDKFFSSRRKRTYEFAVYMCNICVTDGEYLVILKNDNNLFMKLGMKIVPRKQL